ncbi:hypothetical protein cypCar_00014982 [Cyprinus carpio]|nr:hypothetical protein cypCar_00014982 [Cyprinus carpio]
MKVYYILDKQRGPGRLMKKGLTLIVIGHVNFILSAIVHGSVLRHISKPSNAISTEYTVSNIISVTSGLLSIASGIVAILVSRNITNLKLDTTLALWFTCATFTALEAGLSVWCFIVGLQLRGIGPCAQTYIREQVHLSICMQTAQLNEPAV